MTQDYKATLNLPKTQFAMQANLPVNELKIQQRWQGIYQQLRQDRNGKPKFILHDGPPYANGSLHLGHAINKILKDFIIRSKSMQGFDAPFTPGWDCHGLPIENQVEKKKGKAGTKLTHAQFRDACRDYALKQVDIQKNEFERMGLMADWDNPYLTVTRKMEADTVRLMAKLYQQKQLICDVKPVYWSVVGRSALAEAEVEYHDKKSLAIDVAYPLQPQFYNQVAAAFQTQLHANQCVNFVIWTTTPWTIPASLAISIHPELTYSLVKVNDKLLIVAKPLLASCLERYQLQGETIANCKGSDLELVCCQHPLYPNRSIKVLCGDHVDEKGGTGCVHTAPDHGLEDFHICKKHHIKTLHYVEDNGVYSDKTPLFAGQHVYKVDPAVVTSLDEANALIHQTEIRHSYPHCWRTKTPLIFRATRQWFIKKLTPESIKKAIDSVNWISDIDQKRMQNYLDTAPDWCITRQRVWGTPIPFLLHKKTFKEHPDTFNIMLQVADAIEQNGMDAWFESKTADWVQQADTEYQKNNDTMDVWFDSGATFFSVLEQNRHLQVPADLYVEGIDQFRGWFQSSLKIAMATIGHPPYKAVLAHGFTIDKDGKKMSKSLGNVVAPETIMKQYGADVLRLWIASRNYRNDLKFTMDSLKRTVDRYRRIRNSIRYCLANLNDFNEQSKLPIEQMLELDKWIYNQTIALQKDVIDDYNNYQFQSAMQRVTDFCGLDLSSFYLDIIKDRIYTNPQSSVAYRSAQTALYHILQTITSLMAPVLCHTMDEVWQFLPKRQTNSVHLSTFETLPQAPQVVTNQQWQQLVALKDSVNQQIEPLRTNKVVGSSLEVTVNINTNASYYQIFAMLGEELRFLLISSTVNLIEDNSQTNFSVTVSKSELTKCQRCWHSAPNVGADNTHPEICLRCVGNISGQPETRLYA